MQKRYSITIIALSRKENDGTNCYWFALWTAAMVNDVVSQQLTVVASLYVAYDLFTVNANVLSIILCYDNRRT